VLPAFGWQHCTYLNYYKLISCSPFSAEQG
jgi:hypothetical protein